MNLIPKINGEVKYYPETMEFGQANIISNGLLPQGNIDLFSQRFHNIGHGENKTTIEIKRSARLMPEEYFLRVEGDRIDVFTASTKGAEHALTSLYHLNSESKDLRHMFLHDYPRYFHREFMIDCARNFFSVDEIKKIIDEASLLKLNVFHWHLSDNQGWRIESKVFPRLNDIGASTGGFYTQEEIKEIVKYAQVRNIEIIPEIDIPGHTGALISAYSFLSCDKREAKVESGYVPNDKALCIGQKETYAFIYRLLDELMELFPGQYFHIGGDEAYHKSWEKCPECQTLMKEESLTDTNYLMGYFLNNVGQYLINNGKKPIVWNDATKCPNLDSFFTIQTWFDYPLDKSNIRTFRDGRNYISSSTFATYFDYPYSLVPIKATYGYIPKINNKFLKGKNLLGTSCHLWTEVVSDTQKLEELLFPRLQAFAESAWTNSLNYDEFIERLIKYIEQLSERGIRFTSLKDATLSGKEAQSDVEKYFKKRLESSGTNLVTSPYDILVGLKITLGLLLVNQKLIDIPELSLRVLKK